MVDNTTGGSKRQIRGVKEVEDATETFQGYFEYNRVLRTWFDHRR
jgi:hypothetical protein